ncbi:uncharacterized protein LOC119961692 isoform X3 [Scyliorhinus canicula]|uniref:uncharacterized protein LOC119961692 isoform X3 n=1 Tax=Scyliorhinus canicula TaxID=7830 RepID=UPI0018F56531|nr:uncharacterized protein LOC119961692 isoform X3 [Scyliorhinus canicula]
MRSITFLGALPVRERFIFLQLQVQQEVLNLKMVKLFQRPHRVSETHRPFDSLFPTKLTITQRVLAERNLMENGRWESVRRALE